MRSAVMTEIDWGISTIGVSVLMPVALRVATKPSTGPKADSGRLSGGAVVVAETVGAPPGSPAEAPGAGLRATVVVRGVWREGLTVMVSSSASLCFGGGEAKGAGVSACESKPVSLAGSGVPAGGASDSMAGLALSVDAPPSLCSACAI